MNREEVLELLKVEKEKWIEEVLLVLPFALKNLMAQAVFFRELYTEVYKDEAINQNKELFHKLVESLELQNSGKTYKELIEDAKVEFPKRLKLYTEAQRSL